MNVKAYATKFTAASLAGIVSTVIAHAVAFACAEGICKELLKLAPNAVNFAYAAGEGLFSTIAIVGILVALGRSSKAFIVSVGFGAFVTFVVAMPAIGVLLKTENILLAVLFCTFGLLTGMFLAFFFNSEVRRVLEKHQPVRQDVSIC